MVADRQIATGGYGLPVGLTFAVGEAAGKAGQGIAGLQNHRRPGQAGAVGTQTAIDGRRQVLEGFAQALTPLVNAVA